MKIKIIFAYKDRRLIERISKEDNYLYLVKEENNPEFPYLSEVEQYDYSMFGSEGMDGIIAELLKVKKELSDADDQEHIDDIIRLANKCKETPDTVLIFAG